ncbi:MAG: NADP-dependent isocitrate dehydrogenase [Thermoprotei archaeon]
MPKFETIPMKTPIVEMDGDEMARVMWKLVKKSLIEPYVDLRTEYYDLGLKHRDETNDRVTLEAAEAIKRLGVGVKCATITPNSERVKEYGLKAEWPSPNATIRKQLGGTIFRKPVIFKNIAPAIRSWKSPIVVARHAFGDIYDAQAISFDHNGKLTLSFSSDSSSVSSSREVEGPGVAEAKVNSLMSIEDFASACFEYALREKMNLWFAAKDTISKVYDAAFKRAFARLYEERYAESFHKAGIEYAYYLIDDAMSRAVRSEGGFVWAAKNYDGDVISDLVAAGFGSVALMTSELYSPRGWAEFEAAHGTVQRHYYSYLRGEKVSTNPTATIFAWSGALRMKAKLDSTPELQRFSDALELAVRKTVETDNVMTKDVAALAGIGTFVTLEEFIAKTRQNLEALLNR